MESHFLMSKEIRKSRINLAIKCSGKRQATIALNMGVSSQRLSNWKRTGEISSDMLLPFAQEVGVTSDWILGFDSPSRRDHIFNQGSWKTQSEKAHSLLREFVDYFNGMEEIFHPLDPLGADEIFVSTYDHMNSEVAEFLRITYPYEEA